MPRIRLFNLNPIPHIIPDRLSRMVEELFRRITIDNEFRIWIMQMPNPPTIALGLSGAMIGKPHRTLPVRPVTIPMLIRPEEQIESVRILDIEIPPEINAEDMHRILFQALEDWQRSHH